MTKATKGNLADKPLAELILEAAEASASGALRLSRERAKAVVYFEQGEVAFAASNIRAHRLVEFLRRTGILDEAAVKELPAKATDSEILSHLTATRRIRAERLSSIRATHVSDVLRGVLLWTDGDWQFDPQVRIAGDTRVRVEAHRLLLQSTRHLPAAYVRLRFPDATEHLQPGPSNGLAANLLPAEAFVLSRISGPTPLNELLTLSGLNEAETLQSLYALVICGAVKRTGESTASFSGAAIGKAAAKADDAPKDEANTLDEFFAMVDKASDYYSLLGVERQAGADAIKHAYHSLARRYHPDRFHQSEAQLRSKIESAFARVAQAYEILGDASRRPAYDAHLASQSSAKAPAETSARERRPATSAETTGDKRAETSFQKGLAATRQNQLQQALRFLAEAASLEPRCARYRAEYGRALINDPQTRRLAEFELKAAINLEPDNTSYRVALAELYKALGLRRRAEGELQRALTSDPKNAAARTLLASLKN